MKPLRKRLEEASKRTSLRLDILQQDYLLSWMLVGIFQDPILKNSLLFKGGTCLKKCYFGNYRFSQDLDFTAKSSLASSKDLFLILKTVTKNTQRHINEYAPIRLFIRKYEEKHPHPHDQEAFIISAQFPWQRGPLTKIMIEISREEIIIFPSQSKNLIHDYGETLLLDIPVYSLEEIILEKLRAILQHTKKLHERNWNRSRARDYYDLWHIFTSFENILSLKNAKKFLFLKCQKKEVVFKNVEAFFEEKMIFNVKNTWKQWLGPLVLDLPDCDTLLNDLKIKIHQMIFE